MCYTNVLRLNPSQLTAFKISMYMCGNHNTVAILINGILANYVQ